MYVSRDSQQQVLFRIHTGFPFHLLVGMPKQAPQGSLCAANVGNNFNSAKEIEKKVAISKKCMQILPNSRTKFFCYAYQKNALCATKTFLRLR